MKNLFAYIPVIAMLGILAGCEEPIVIPEPEVETQVPQELFLKAAVESVQITSAKVSVDVSEATTFYIENYETSFYENQGLTPKLIARQMKEKVDLGLNWSALLNAGSQTIDFKGLKSGTQYTVVAFGINGLGEITTEETILQYATPPVSFDVALEESRPFDFVVKVTPDRDDIGWFSFTFIGPRDYMEKMSDELVSTYIGYYMSNFRQNGATYEELTTEGVGFSDNECYPDLDFMVAVVAVDKDFRIVSSPFRTIFSPSHEGFLELDRKSTKNLETLIYAYDHKELGVLLHVTGYDADDMGVIANTMSFNGDSEKFYGFDFYPASDESIADIMASWYQYQFDMALNDPDYKPYFDQCVSYQQMLEMIWYTPQNIYDNGRLWDRNDADEIIADYCDGNQPDQLVFVLGINKIDSDMKIYPAEYCISRCSFSEIGYTFGAEQAADSAKAVAKSSSAELPCVKGAVIDARTGKAPSFKRYPVRKF